MVVISDEEARGFFSTMTRCSAPRGKSKTDLDNKAAGKEATIDRTLQILYVACSRAER
jgi:DNA helicase-2/ATP-dependent DNA helicase PcrA